jgi:hypothetical protein
MPEAEYLWLCICSCVFFVWLGARLGIVGVDVDSFDDVLWRPPK